ncbi:hypothetical protein [Streptomyces sp. CAU 1734]|uniref:hypothetical protein n=1 Tax=Streptomyces sp. CAU 1734 TaxID=3140360 RepID=UPI00325FFC69
MKMFRTAAVTAVVVGLTAGSFSAATAAPAPKFLTAKQLPAAPTPWTAGPVQAGTAKEDFCNAKVAPKASSKHRVFRTEADTGAHQTITVLPTEAKAKALVTKLRTSVAGCLARIQRQYPDLEGTTRHHGRIDIEEGAHVYSIDTHDPEVGSTDISLFSIGRDGRTVTVVGWGQMGDLVHAPLKGFQKTTRTAVAKLY